MRVLVACEFSGVVRDAFRRRGHIAVSCDLLETECVPTGCRVSGDCVYDESDRIIHFKQSAESVIRSYDWDLMIAHPPCTFLTNAGVRWLYKDGRIQGNKKNVIPAMQEPGRWRDMQLAADFFGRLLNAPIPHVCIENPVMHKYGVAIVGRVADQIIQPWMFGHAETKATCLWLKGLPELHPSNVVRPDYDKYPPGKGNGFEPRVHHASPSPDRWKERSRTLAGIADAFAAQWGCL